MIARDTLERCFAALELVAVEPGADGTGLVAFCFLDQLPPFALEMARSYLAPVTETILELSGARSSLRGRRRNCALDLRPFFLHLHAGACRRLISLATRRPRVCSPRDEDVQSSCMRLHARATRLRPKPATAHAASIRAMVAARLALDPEAEDP